MRAAYRARWAQARDLSQPALVGKLLAEAGLPEAESLATSESDALRARLDRDTQQAIERGVFGVPTIFVGERMLWGNDRFELARYFITKEAVV